MGGNKNSSRKDSAPNDENFGNFGFDLSDDEEEVPNRGGTNDKSDRFEKLP